MHPQTTEFMALFKGWDRNYGVYKLTGEITDTGKQVGKALSLKGDVTVELWSDHLVGKQGLGIIPITDESKVRFAAIDIDQYDLDLLVLNKKIIDNKLPLVLCRTKSGGAHLYMFLSDWTPAKLVQEKMREMASFLGYGSCEIFPTPTTTLAERGDIGQWINMPYFNSTDTKRYALDNHNEILSVEKFCRFAFDKVITPEELVALKIGDGNDILYEAPPCLNHLVKMGFPMGTRNNGLFNLGVYAQLFSPDRWQELIAEYNQKFMDPPLTESEVKGVIKSLDKGKGYKYSCKQQPICSHCDAAKCRIRKYGIGLTGVGMPKYGTLTKIDTRPPIWFVDVEGGGRIELETSDLQFLRNFQTKCMEHCNVMPSYVKQEIWAEVVSKLLEEVIIVEMPKEASPHGQLHAYLEEFCCSRVQAKTHDGLLLGQPWTNGGHHYFRMRDFMEYLSRRKFTSFRIQQVAVYLRDWGADKHFFNIKGHGVNCYKLPEFKNGDIVLDVPETAKTNF